jgi:hypothetical protein
VVEAALSAAVTHITADICGGESERLREILEGRRGTP